MDKVIKVLQLLPAIFTAVRAIEEALPQEGAGKDKLSMLREIMEAAYPAVTELWSAIEKTVSVIVGVFNAKGIFQK